jgi:hypothetical protein
MVLSCEGLAKIQNTEFQTTELTRIISIVMHRIPIGKREVL